jgi:hypothetical protein
MTGELIQKTILFFIGLCVAYFCFLLSYTIHHDAYKFSLNYFDHSYCVILSVISFLIGLLILVYEILNIVSPKYSSKIPIYFTK